MGVPYSKIYTETRSQNTGENIRFTYELLKTSYKVPQRIILVQKPHMGRRTAATFQRQWRHSNTSMIVRTLQISLDRYPSDDVGDLSDVISVMMGYMQRMPLYHKLGFQNYVYIPPDVMESFKLLQQTNLYNSYFIWRVPVWYINIYYRFNIICFWDLNFISRMLSVLVQLNVRKL